MSGGEAPTAGSGCRGGRAGQPGGGGLPPPQHVLTPAGYRPVAEIAVGGTVLGPDGVPLGVVAVEWCDFRGDLHHLRTADGLVLRGAGGQQLLARPEEGVPRWWPLSALRPGDLVAVHAAGAAALSGGWRRGSPVEPVAAGTARQPLGRATRATAFPGLDWVPLVTADAAPYIGPLCRLRLVAGGAFVSDGLVCAGGAGD